MTSDKPVPKPRVDEQGVPWCNGTCCWYQTQPLVRPECCAPCHVGTPCLPAVRAMARDLAEARAEAMTARKENDALLDIIPATARW